ncbi:S-adenosylmethionine decarboxylase proenzyme precursor [Enhygromyxa salina]|uniref:Adenosylmethionine decarboxylase n=1 Tax=Enhygromyxa salina TaxID=215803 RepID=A0A2S9XCC8_9BACT|nr:adenosylmethionine decarboxylase [Enhygromyxa salina]PRP90508.1 S-adenosylmethionine decarboxylase proenzyme precursor [Enhygromyxa salina]
MPLSREPIRLEGFNNLTKVVSFNLYDFVVARTEAERDSYVKYLHDNFSGPRITKILAKIAQIIDAEVLSVSAQDYDPYGASSLVLMSDLGHGQVVEREADGEGAGKIAASVGAHLTKSHLCAHTYPDVLDPRGICSFRVDIDIATCGTIVPLRALDYMFESFENDVVIIDYVVRGFTRDTQGNRVYMDHSVRSIQDFIDPGVLADYECEDLALPSQNIWQTKMMRTDLDPKEYFAPGIDPFAPESRELLGLIKREMAGIFNNLPN